VDRLVDIHTYDIERLHGAPMPIVPNLDLVSHQDTSRFTIDHGKRFESLHDFSSSDRQSVKENDTNHRRTIESLCIDFKGSMIQYITFTEFT